jgi:hypothetical protein
VRIVASFPNRDDVVCGALVQDVGQRQVSLEMEVLDVDRVDTFGLQRSG